MDVAYQHVIDGRVNQAVAGNGGHASKGLGHDPHAIVAEPTGSANKRKARYQANTPEVQNFYRVNRYPAR